MFWTPKRHPVKLGTQDCSTQKIQRGHERDVKKGVESSGKKAYGLHLKTGTSQHQSFPRIRSVGPMNNDSNTEITNHHALSSGNILSS